jgi:Ca2+-binding RTX toxin-like protein
MADVTGPTLTSLTIPGSIDLVTGPTAATFAVSALDAESGVQEAAIWFNRPFADNIGTFPLVGLYDFVDSWSDGTSATVRTTSQFAGPGTYTVDHVDITDKAGNKSIYSGSALAASGFDTSFTIVNGDYRPTEGADVLGGSALADVLSGQGGDDRMSGLAENDLIYGNAGSDLVYGNAGTDTLYGGQGADIVFGGQNGDVVYGNLRNDQVYGNLGDDSLSGGRGSDILFGGQGNDILNGNAGDDVLVGGRGGDLYVFGRSSGADIIRGFDQSTGDRLDLQGQSYAKVDAAGGALLTLSGGGSVLIEGVAAQSITTTSFSYTDPTNAFNFS